METIIPTQINQKRFTRLFMDTTDKSAGIRFSFLLGAGASCSSGIPTGQEFAKGWYQQILDDLDVQELDDWKKEVGSSDGGLSPNYRQILKKRFQYEPESASKELLGHIQGVQPSLGYLILARILDKTQHNFVISTNFDHLLEKALFTATHQAPLVCRHEKLAISTLSQTTPPILIKTQQDLVLNPNFIRHQGQRYDEAMSGSVASILENFRLVVIGSGGNDECFMSFMESIEPQNRQPIFWCVRDSDNINPRVLNILTKGDYVVRIDGFDELMYELSDVCDLEGVIDIRDVNKSSLVINAKKETQTYLSQMDKLAKGSIIQTDAITTDSKTSLSDTGVICQEKKQITSDRDFVQNNDTLEDLLQLNHNPFKKMVRTESYYIQLLSEESENAKHSANYALYLQNIKKDDSLATTYFEKSIALAPNNARIYCLYAYFLNKALRHYNEAEVHYLLALELSPEDTTMHVLYAIFLHKIRENHEKAEVHFRSGLQVDKGSINYNQQYRDIRTDYLAAEKYYRHALEADFLIE